ncbi:MAG: TMEM175 family protein [Devosia sp.]
MGKGRIEAFSDGVLAVIITIMVLELHVPEGFDLSALLPLYPRFLSYILSFVMIGIYWNNHHHLMHSVQHVNGRVLWANNFLLFWLSLVPFSTDWMGETHFALWPVVVYGAIMFLAGAAFSLLVVALRSLHGENSALAEALGNDWKGIASAGLWLAGIGSAFINPYIACAIYAGTALMWFIPDRRIERRLSRG